MTPTVCALSRKPHPEGNDIHSFSLADAFTVCDQYHCPVLGPTDPNRYFMFTGKVGRRRAQEFIKTGTWCLNNTIPDITFTLHWPGKE